MYGGQIDERTLEKTQQQHMLYQQEQHHQILQQQIQVGLHSLLCSVLVASHSLNPVLLLSGLHIFLLIRNVSYGGS